MVHSAVISSQPAGLALPLSCLTVECLTRITFNIHWSGHSKNIHLCIYTNTCNLIVHNFLPIKVSSEYFANACNPLNLCFTEDSSKLAVQVQKQSSMSSTLFKSIGMAASLLIMVLLFQRTDCKLSGQRTLGTSPSSCIGLARSSIHLWRKPDPLQFKLH